MLALLCVVVTLGVGAVAIRGVVLPHWRGAAARLAEIILGLGLLVLVLEALGAVGLFRLVPMVAASIAVGLGLRSWRSRVLTPRPTSRLASLRPNALAVGVAVLAAGVVIAEWAGITTQSFDGGIVGADSVAYHLPWAASFAQTGQITGIRYTDIEWLTGFYPATSEMLHGFGIVVMGTDVLSPAINVLWLAVLLLAAWCVGSPFGLGPTTVVGGALAMAPPMMFFSTAGSADSDAAAAAVLLAGVALWVNVATRAGPARDIRPSGARAAGDGTQTLQARALLPAALAAGLAISVKLNVVIPALALVAAMIVWAPRGHRAAVAKISAATVIVGGAFWYLRNLFAVGNPLPYFRFGVLPTPQPPPTQAHNNFSISDYLTYPRILKDVFTKMLAQGLGPWWVEILLIAVIGAALCVLFGPDRLVRLLGLLALVSLGAYLFTPGSASGPWGHPRGLMLNLRYVAPVLALAFTATPLSAPLRGRRIRWLVLAGFAATLLATVAQSRLWGTQARVPGQVLTAMLLLIVGGAIVLKPWSKIPGPPMLRRVVLATAAVTLALAGVAAGYSGTRHYLRGRYNNPKDPSSVAQAYRWARTVHQQRIALAGTFGWYFGYPLYGPDNSNMVVYLGRHGTHGSFRPVASCRAWRLALNQGHYQYVVTSGTRTMWTGAVRPAPEGAWTRNDSGVKLMFPLSDRAPIEVFRVVGRLHPALC